MKPRVSWFVAAAILLTFLSLSGLMVALKPEPERKPSAPRIPVAITVPASVGAEVIPLYGAGTVRPRAEIDVSAEISGKIAWVAPAFQSGGRVHEGQALFLIHDADYRNRVEQVRADVATQQVTLLQATEEARIARSEYEQFRRLQAGAGRPTDASPLTLRKPQLDAAKAALQKAMAALADAELALSRTEVRAPFDGIVRTEAVAIGQFVNPGESVGRLYATDAVEVVVPLTDSDAALIPGLWELEAGDEDNRVAARVTAEYGGKSYVWNGYVDRVEGDLDEQTRTLDLIVRVADPFKGGVPAVEDTDVPRPESGAFPASVANPPLLVGTFVEVQIQGRAPDRYFIVPASALRLGNEVWAIRNDTVTIVPVRILQRSNAGVFITGALEAGQAVVVGGIEVVTEGMEVRARTGEIL